MPMLNPKDIKIVPHSDKVNMSNLQMGHVTPASGKMKWNEVIQLLREQSKEAERRYEDFIKAEQARADAENTQKLRAEAWKAMAERLVDELRRVQFDKPSLVREDNHIIQAFDALKRSDP